MEEISQRHFCILKIDAAEKLLSHLNSLRLTIQFTVEVDRDGSLPFLDILLRRKDDDSLGIKVYRTSTHTDRYLDFQSPHPHHVKRGLVRCLYNSQEQHQLTGLSRAKGAPHHHSPKAELLPWCLYPTPMSKKWNRRTMICRGLHWCCSSMSQQSVKTSDGFAEGSA